MSALKRWLAALALVAGAGLLAGCQEALPTCSDKEVHDLITQIFFKEMVSQEIITAITPGWLDKVKKTATLDLSMIRTTKSDERHGERLCEAQLSINLPERFGPLPVVYRIQQSDDGENLTVQITGHEMLASAAAVADRALERERAAARAASQAATQPPTPPVTTIATAAAPTTASARTVSDATLIWLECGDRCHLQYKTADGEVTSALCEDPAICRQWGDNLPEFKKHVGAHANLKLVKKFVQEAGEAVDTLQELEWRP